MPASARRLSRHLRHAMRMLLAPCLYFDLPRHRRRRRPNNSSITLLPSLDQLIAHEARP